MEMRIKEKNFPRAAAVIILINCICFILAEFVGSTTVPDTLIRCGALYSPLVNDGQYWRFITSMFMHSGVQHLINNMLTLYVLSDIFERELGTVKYIVVYLLGGIAGNVIEFVLDMRTEGFSFCVGASGAVFAVLGGLIAVLIINRGHVRGMTLKRILIMAALSVYSGFASPDIAVAAHLGGMASGFLMALLLYRKKRKDTDREKDPAEG